MRGLVAALVVVAGCGGGGGNSSAPDARIADARVADGSPLDAPAACVAVSGTPGVITVNVLAQVGDASQYGLPLAGARVFFVERDCSATMVLSDGGGVAVSPAVHDGTTVVVIQEHEATQGAIAMFLDVAAGTTLQAGPDLPLPQLATQLGTFHVDGTAFSTADLYALSLPCGFASGQPLATPSFTVTPLDPCDRTDRALIAYAIDSSVGTIGFSTMRADFTPGGDLTLPAFQPVGDLTISISNAAAEVTGAHVETRYFDADKILANGEANGALTAGAADLHAVATPSGEHLDVATFFEGPPGYSGRPRLVQSGAIDATTATVDATDMLPFLDTWTWDPSTQAIAWEEFIGTGSADLVIAAFYSYSAGSGPPFGLRVFAPHGGPSLVLPPLPADVVEVLPGVDFGGNLTITLVDVTSVPDYAGLVSRADPDSRWTLSTGPRYGTSAEAWISAVDVF
jgi:hypothetical protein